jgi:HK97 family phage prohead protease
MAKRPQKELVLHVASLDLLTRAASDLPKGVCGVVQGVALTYNTIDTYGTTFLPGCLNKTRQQKLAAGKIPLFGDHEHTTFAHVGTVVAMDDVGDAVAMTAHLFDTEEGRSMKEYLASCMATKSFTGLSVGVYPRDVEWVDNPTAPGSKVLGYKEVELAEVSITPMPSVDGAEVTGLRSRTPKKVLGQALRGIAMAMDPDEVRAIIDQLIPPVPPETEVTPPVADPVTADPGEFATMEQRFLAARATAY